MQTLPPYLITFAGFGAAYEEAFRVTSHAAHSEVRRQAERKMPTGSPRPRK